MGRKHRELRLGNYRKSGDDEIDKNNDAFFLVINFGDIAGALFLGF